MGKDTTAFRERFKAYKNGKSVSEIYDAGLPRYAEGTELPIEQMMPYILAVENPTKQGLVNGVWRPPTDSSKWDTHAIGGGLDIREENNPIVYNYLKSKGRLNNPYLTVAEEEMLRKQTFEKTTLPTLRKMYGKYKDKISEKGYARLAGMKWQGHPYLMAITPDSITGKAFLNAVASGDRDLDSVFDAYYKYPANAKRYGARINADVNYWKNYSTPSNVEPKSELVQLLEQLDKEKFLPWSNYHSPDYSLSNPAPSTISSWNNPTSPAFNTSGLYARRATNNINNVVQDILFNDKDPLDALMDNLSKNVFGGKRLGFKNGKLPGYRGGKGDDLDETELYLIDNSSLSAIDKALTSISSKIMNYARFYGTGVKSSDDSIKLRRELDGGTAQKTFLLPRSVQERVFEDDGYIKGVPGDYGLVRKGVGNRKLPVYQTHRDAISRKDLAHLYNILDGGYDTMYIDPYKLLVHAGSFPSAIYVDGSTGELYQKAWDLNDYGSDRGGTRYENFDQILANMLSKVGNPVVVTTGYLPMVNEYGQRRNLSDRLNQNDYRETQLYNAINTGLLSKGLHLEELNGKLVPMLPGIDVILDKTTGNLSTYKNGKSPIHIKPANRGKFTALKKRTGHSASWFKENGTPAQKKMAVFALNAKKWKH